MTPTAENGKQSGTSSGNGLQLCGHKQAGRRLRVTAGVGLSPRRVARALVGRPSSLPKTPGAWPPPRTAGSSPTSSRLTCSGSASPGGRALPQHLPLSPGRRQRVVRPQVLGSYSSSGPQGNGGKDCGPSTFLHGGEEYGQPEQHWACLGRLPFPAPRPGRPSVVQSERALVPGAWGRSAALTPH